MFLIAKRAMYEIYRTHGAEFISILHIPVES
jgi:hypothetical protein